MDGWNTTKEKRQGETAERSSSSTDDDSSGGGGGATNGQIPPFIFLLD